MKKKIFVVVAFAVHAFSISLAQSSYWTTHSEEKINYGIEEAYFDSINNEFYVGGGFGRIGSDSIYGIGMWDGSNWHSLGKGLDYHEGSPLAWCNVFTIRRYQNMIVAGGNFSTADDLPIPFLAGWDGTHWQSLQASPNGVVFNMIVKHDSLFICGDFDSIGNVAADGIAMFNGNTWESLNLQNDDPNPFEGNEIFDMAFYNGEMYIVGRMKDYSGYLHKVKRKIGQNWFPVEPEIQGGGAMPSSLTVYKNKLIVAGGTWSADLGNADNNIQAWDGSQWFSMGGGTNNYIYGLLAQNEKLYVYGSFKSVGDEVPANFIAVWDGARWCGFPGIFYGGKILSAEFYHDTLFVTGGFDSIDHVSTPNLAKYLGGDYVDSCGASVGISEIVMPDFTFSLSPNPFTTRLQLHYILSQPGELMVYDALGRKVKLLTLAANQNSMELSLAELPAGVYLVAVNGGRQVWSEKVVKE